MTAGGAALRVGTRRAELLALLDAHAAGSPREARSLATVRRLVVWLRDPFGGDPAHVTASAIVVDGADHVLLHRHRRLGAWLQPGGHVEADEHPHDAAVRETVEETGVTARHPPAGPRLLHVDVHPTPWGHIHLDLRYLLLAPPGAPIAPGAEESHEVAWMPRGRAADLADPGLTDALARL